MMLASLMISFQVERLLSLFGGLNILPVFLKGVFYRSYRLGHKCYVKQVKIVEVLLNDCADSLNYSAILENLSFNLRYEMIRKYSIMIR